MKQIEMKWFFLVLLFLTHFSALAESRPKGKDSAFFNTESVKLGSLSSEMILFPFLDSDSKLTSHPVIISNDGQRFAYVARNPAGTKFQVIDNQHKGKEYDQVFDLVFSPDGQKLAYTAQEGEANFLVLNNQEGKRYGKNQIVSRIIFSPDSQRIAYGVGNVSINPYEQIAVVDGKEEKIKDYHIDLIGFSPDSKDFLYVVRGLVTEKIVRNGEIIKEISAEQLTFSPDLKKLAYSSSGTYKVMDLNSFEEKEYKRSGAMKDRFIFSSDGQKTAQLSSRSYETYKLKYLVGVNGLEQKEYDFIDHDSIQFSPDGKNLAYTVTLGLSDISRLRQSFVVLDGKEQKKYDRVRFFTFSPNGNKWAYKAWKDQKTILVLNGEELKEVGPIADSPLVFSPDGKRLAYIVADEKAGEDKVFVRVGTQQGKTFDGIRGLRFSPDGQYIGYNARLGNEIWWVAEPIKQ